MQIGIVGLPFSGKTTLYQTLTRSSLDEAAGHRQQAHVAMVKVPDARVDTLGTYFHPKKHVYTSVEFVDVVGLKKGDHDSTQFTGAFLASVKTNDALIHVVRAFDDPLYPHPEGSIDPERDIRILEAEFLLSDMAILEGRIDRMKKQLQKSPDDKQRFELRTLEKALAAVEQERPLRIVPFDVNERHAIQGYQFLTAKPLLALFNYGEVEAASGQAASSELRARVAAAGIAVDAFSGKIEMELAQLADEDAREFMADYGITESALTRIIASAYRMLGLITFLTAGEDECRAWAIRRGMNAQEAAAEIHTDLGARFIRAEVVHFEDFVAHGSYAACKEKGFWRLEGKEYIVRDGDMLLIRHSG